MGVAEWGIDDARVFCSGIVAIECGVSYLPWYLLVFRKPNNGGPLLVAR